MLNNIYVSIYIKELLDRYIFTYIQAHTYIYIYMNNKIEDIDFVL